MELVSLFKGSIKDIEIGNKGKLDDVFISLHGEEDQKFVRLCQRVLASTDQLLRQHTSDLQLPFRILNPNAPNFSLWRP